MIPLNRPKIYNSNLDLDVLSELRKVYQSENIHYTFSARQALDIVYRSIFKERGKIIVYTTPLTCFEALYPIINNGHEILFGDINPITLNLALDNLPNGYDAIQTVYLGGNPYDMSSVVNLVNKKNCILIEDCAQAFGSEYYGRPLGSFGHYAGFSFFKNLHSLGGGFLISQIPLDFPKMSPSDYKIFLYRKAKRFLESKLTYNRSLTGYLYNLLISLKPDNTSTTFNTKTIDKRILRSIINQFSNWQLLIEKRIENALYVRSNIENKNLAPQAIPSSGTSSFTRLFYISKNLDTQTIVNRLRKFGIGANHLTQDSRITFQKNVNDNPDFSRFARNSSLTNYLRIHDYVFSVPISASLKKTELDYIIQKVNEL